MKHLTVVMLIMCGFSGFCLSSIPRQISDTWVATDALGRTLPGHEQVGNAKDDKYVAMFYWTWHTERHADGGVVNVNQIVSTYPEAINDYDHPAWEGRIPGGNHWNEPLFGYYRIQDKWVLRKHAEMLSDAGVDVVVFDCSNFTITWRNGYETLAKVWLEARKDGVKTPKIAFLCPFGAVENSRIIIETLWEDIYSKDRFKDLWFYWKGKPLIMAYPDNVPEKIKNFFTFRPAQAGYRTGPSRKDHWSWLEVYPQNGYGEYAPGKYEMVAVGVAQNATDTLAPAAMNDKDQVYSRSYTHANGFDDRPEAHHYGLNFQEQWSRAFELDPELVFITGWNEWIAGRFTEWQGTENAFPDQFCNECSRDIEPMKGGHGDNYYYQLISNIRRFKGVRPQASASGIAAIKIDGDFRDWRSVKPLYVDHKGDTLHRKHRGYGHDLLYINRTGRNDFIRAKVGYNQTHVFFYMETARTITPESDSDWMMLLIDIDRNKNTGEKGYDYMVNRERVKTDKTSIHRYDKFGGWKELSEIDYKVNDNKIELAIQRSSLFAEGAELSFEFKWIDNIKSLDYPMNFYLYGDVAPSARFNYLYSCDL